MDAVVFPDHLGLPHLAADALIDNGLLDALIDTMGRALKSLPSAFVRWLGPELRTPENSGPPTITFAEDGPWNGVIFVESDEASFWVLVKAGPDRRHRGASPAGRPFGDPFGRGGAPSQRWDEPYGYEPPPWEHEPWRR